MAKVTMPQLGESVAEGTIGKWLKQPGDAVAKYEPLLEVITDKVNAEVPSPFAGILREILVEEGATVPNNAEIAVIETAEETAAGDGRSDDPDRREGRPGSHRGGRCNRAEGHRSDSSRGARPTRGRTRFARGESRQRRRNRGCRIPRPRAGSRDGPARGCAGPRADRGRVPVAVASSAPATGDRTEAAEGEGRMTPAVRRLLREHGLNAAQIVGTGRRRSNHARGRPELRRIGADRPGGPRPGRNGATPGGTRGRPSAGQRRPPPHPRPRPPPQPPLQPPPPPPRQPPRRPAASPARRSSSPRVPTKSSCP